MTWYPLADAENKDHIEQIDLDTQDNEEGMIFVE